VDLISSPFVLVKSALNKRICKIRVKTGTVGVLRRAILGVRSQERINRLIAGHYSAVG
jgi:hypothetical protein